MIRLLIFIGLGYLVYRLARAFLFSEKGARDDQPMTEGGLPKRIDDELVQDPVCKTYVPLREAEKRRIDGREYFFCSRACADRFLEEGAKEREE